MHRVLALISIQSPHSEAHSDGPIECAVPEIQYYSSPRMIPLDTARHVPMAADGEASLALCAISSWYPSLRHVSIKTTLLPLNDEVVRYLLADGCFVPADADCDADTPSGSEAADGEWSDGGWSDDGEDCDAAASRFPELEAAIAAAIRKHGGSVFPKLNWSAPKDAAWVLGGSLKCTSPRDVLLLLKSSDHISHDLCHARHDAALSTMSNAIEEPPSVGEAEPWSVADGTTGAATAAVAADTIAASYAAAAPDGAAVTTATAAATAALGTLELSTPLPAPPMTHDPVQEEDSAASSSTALGGSQSVEAGAAAPAAAMPGFRWVLALRRWSNLRPSSEYRCFGCAGGRRLLSACQRDRFSHYPFLIAERERTLALLGAFAARHLGEHRPAAGGRPALSLPSRLVWDAYVDIEGHVHLLDVAPFHASTDPLLFEWAELDRLAEQAEAAPTAAVAAHTELRLVGPNSGGVAPSAQLYYGLPHDLQTGTGTDVATLLAAARRAAGAEPG